jgi:MFS family permease
MKTSYPQLDSQFGLLTGFAYTLPFSLFGLYFGKLNSKVNRKWGITIGMALTGCIMLIAGLPNSFAALAASRVLLGVVSACFNPFTFSILSDYFPPERRGFANNIIQSGNYVGWGLSSLSIMAITAMGWRNTYAALGIGSVALAAIIALFVKEPQRDRFL